MAGWVFCSSSGIFHRVNVIILLVRRLRRDMVARTYVARRCGADRFCSVAMCYFIGSKQKDGDVKSDRCVYASMCFVVKYLVFICLAIANPLL